MCVGLPILVLIVWRECNGGTKHRAHNLSIQDTCCIFNAAICLLYIHVRTEDFHA